MTHEDAGAWMLYMFSIIYSTKDDGLELMIQHISHQFISIACAFQQPNNLRVQVIIISFFLQKSYEMGTTDTSKQI